MKPRRGRHFPLTRLCEAAVAGWLLMASAGGAIGALDNVPGATLLLPYFEIDANGPHAGTLLFTVHNVDSHPHIAHVTLWTDVGIPTFSFDVYLAGKGQVEIDLRTVLAGIVPHTSQTLANEGAQSSPNTSFPGCDTRLPTPRLSEANVQALRAAHAGLQSGLWGGLCGAYDYGDQKARGYVTIDVVNQCSTSFPGAPSSGSTPAYFVSGGNGIASNDNVLWGDYRIVDDAENQAYAALLVSIEADEAIQSGYTFYGRLVHGDASDNRERLPDAWDARHAAGGAFQEAYLQIWRDAGAVAPWTCGGTVPGISHRQIWAFDEEENPACLSDEDPSDGTVTLVPRAASRIQVGAAGGFPVLSPFGFISLDLRLGAGTADPLFGGANQSHVSTVHKANGRFGGLTEAWPTTADLVPYVDPPFPRLHFDQASCAGGTVTLDTPSSGTPVLRVWGPAGVLQFWYRLTLVDNVARQLTGEIIGQPGNQWIGDPTPAPVKTATAQPYQAFETFIWWNYHEVVAPFPDFEIRFYVPGGSAAQSLSFLMHYEGEAP
jgi:hypothetical protein